MFGSRSLQLDERRQASRRSFEARILTSRKVFSEESERKSESSYWLLKSEDNGSGKMAAHVGTILLLCHYSLYTPLLHSRHCDELSAPSGEFL
ncbi:uncharacterized protein TNCV_2023171 [Trichonephila clavipes]|nr:uncharacterized protein TNCV_2023171 [Trichonephila clavipes]